MVRKGVKEESSCRDNRKFDLLNACGNVQPPDAWGGKLARVDVGNLPHSSVDALQVFALHHQDRLGGVKVELRSEKSGAGSVGVGEPTTNTQIKVQYNVFKYQK